jgi:RNA polymerase sigma factor (sigma-70 family)
MDGEQDAQSLDFDAALALHLDTLTNELTIQVRKVYRSWRLPRDTSEIEHEVAGLFVGILEARRNYDPLRGSFKAWANKVAMCRLADRQRQLARERNRLTVQYESSYASEAAFDLLIEYCATSRAPEPPDDQVEVLLHELDRLPEKERVAIRRRFFNEEEYVTIACDFAISEAAARGVVCRGLKQLGSRVRAAVACST